MSIKWINFLTANEYVTYQKLKSRREELTETEQFLLRCAETFKADAKYWENKYIKNRHLFKDLEEQ